jgi:glycosyltransferase involved in cell wall biosynthesis
LKECLAYLSENLSDQYRVIAFVHDSARLPALRNIECREYKKARRSWLFRLYYEYVHFFFVSRRLKPHLWLSLHDITPNVAADIRAVYCHNPSPFYSFSFRSLLSSYQFALFSLLYKYLYRINIRRNNYVIVQQDWIRIAFQKMYGIRNVVVAYPSAPQMPGSFAQPAGSAKTTFFYPAFPRVFKNIETVAEAAKLLHEQGRTDFEVLLTIDGKENTYARHIVDKYKGIPAISFAGLKPRDEVYRLYQQVTALIFCSKLETWGLPISEFKAFNKPMLLPDLPYAHETVGDYDKVKFYDPNDPHQLAACMKALMDKNIVYDGNRRVEIREPFAKNWEQLFKILLIRN